MKNTGGRVWCTWRRVEKQYGCIEAWFADQKR